MATQSIPAGYKLVPDTGIETQVAGGKAEAMAAFLASGGERKIFKKSGREGAFTKGALKGKTIEEAKQMFEQRWSTASPAIKDKYAKRAGDAAFAPSELVQIGKLKPAPTNESLNAALPGETSAQVYARQRAERMKQAGENPAAASKTAAEAKRQRDDEMAKASAAMTAKGAADASAPAISPAPSPTPAPASTPEQVGAEARRLMSGEAAPASPAMPAKGTPTFSSPTPSPASPSGMSPLAQREFNRRSTAAAATPTGVPVISQGEADAYKGPKMGSVNRLTGLPMGFQPGDKIDGADPAMQARADQSVARQQIADSKAAVAPEPGFTKPETKTAVWQGMGGFATSATDDSSHQERTEEAFGRPKSSTPQIGSIKPSFQPETRYTPGMGNVPVAKPVADGSEQVSYGDYEAAGARMKTAGGNSKQDSQDAALRSQFDKQAFQRQADEARRKREASMRPAYAGPGVIRPVTVGRRS